MKIKDIQIDGFGVWSGLSVDSMPDEMTVFYGPNEAGKTTLMQFLRTMFYGFTSDRRVRYLPPVHGGKPGGSIRVTGPGGGYEITRRAQLDEKGSSGQLTVTGNDGLSQGQHRLAILLGQVDESIFTNVFAIGLRELQELSTLDDTAAADELYKLSSGLDRVSLVDVTRQLRNGRQEICGPSPEHGQMQQLLLKREKLRDEIDQLTSHGRRWNELAALKTTQSQELDDLKLRIEQSETEAKAYEVALQVRPNWVQRAEIKQAIADLNARTDLPESSADRLAEIAQQVQQRQGKLDELRNERKSLRDKASSLPLRRGIMELTAKIEAASEQSPWIASLQKNIQRLENQIEETRSQLLEDGKRLGISEEDQQALLDEGRIARLPDLSRQAINQLAEPASQVRLHSTRLKQAKQQSEADKKEADRLAKKLSEAMEARGQQDIQIAMQSNAELISLLRKRLHVQEALDKQIARREQLEEEAVDLAVDEALPVERSFLMGILFVGGAFLTLWGMGKLLPFFNPQGDMDTQTGLLFVVVGMFMLFFGLMWSNVLDRNTVSDLEEVEDQIDAIKKEIRKTEVERDDLERRLPPHNGAIESRLREAEHEVSELESLLPLQHNHEAAKQRYKEARRRAAQAAESLRTARHQWQKTLTHLGLAETLSPKSIRIMADGYESLLQTKRRLKSLEDELENRQLELGAITARIDTLARQAFAVETPQDIHDHESWNTEHHSHEGVDDNTYLNQGQSEHSDYNEHDLQHQRRGDANGRRKERGQYPESNRRHAEQVSHGSRNHDLDREPMKAGVQAAARALQQLNKLTSLVTSQEQYIRQRRELKEQDQQLAKQMVAVQKGIDKLHRSHSALLAELGCESEEQLHELLEGKQQHERLSQQLQEFSERIVSMIGGTVPYETVERLLDNPGSDDLERRWEAIQQRTQQAESRVAQLHQRQGEISQEMKSLADSHRLAEVKLEAACVENQLKACAAHWQTLGLTTLLLDRVCEVYETERQPETLREASAFLHQLTEGKYVRIWTPLGKNQLRIDNAHGQALPLEVLSRGTREAVFIALRLSLAAAYARRGVTIPLVLDDVLVNFDSVRAESAAKVLRDFAALGHQVVMFTCHEHIMRIFYDIGVQVRVLPNQGKPGDAEVYTPEPEEPAFQTPEPVERIVYVPQPVSQVPPEPEPEPEPEVDEPIEEPVEAVESDVDEEPEVEPEVVPEPVEVEPTLEQPVAEPEPEPEVFQIAPPKPTPKPRKVVSVEQSDIDWLWYERNIPKPQSDWVESDDQVDERHAPSDLWWNRGSRALSAS